MYNKSKTHTKLSYYRRTPNFQPYNKQNLLDRINKIEIIREENQVITKYDGRVTAISDVSNKYEVFDIKKYIQEKLDLIEKNFEIKEFYFSVTKGIQQLKLISDTIEINGMEFHKTFFIINSSDRSRRLQFNSGLYSKGSNFYMVSTTQNLGLSKKHYRGITDAAEEATKDINVETFDEQIEAIQKLVGHKVAFSKLRKVMVGDGSVKTNHLKFDKLKEHLLWALREDKSVTMTGENYSLLRKRSQYAGDVDPNKDFYMDAFMVFQVYMKLYSHLDSHIVKTETERILGITQWAVRNELLGDLLAV